MRVGEGRELVPLSERFCVQCGCRKGFSSSSNPGSELHLLGPRCCDCSRHPAPAPVRFDGASGGRLVPPGLPRCGAWEQVERAELPAWSGNHEQSRMPNLARAAGTLK